MLALLLGLLLLAVVIGTAGLQIYGLILSFQKKWYIGLFALVVPAFALVVGAAKLFKKDIL